jgi:hypothetical protein
MPEGDTSDFSVIEAVISHGHKRAFKKAAGIDKINAVFHNIGEPLFFVPFKFHGFSVFTFCKDVNAEIPLALFDAWVMLGRAL